MAGLHVMAPRIKLRFLGTCKPYELHQLLYALLQDLKLPSQQGLGSASETGGSDGWGLSTHQSVDAKDALKWGWLPGEKTGCSIGEWDGNRMWMIT
jgi:hypothetical protein